MNRAVIDRDITPTERLLARLPADWETTVGIETDSVSDALAGVDVAFVTSRVPLSREHIERASDLAVIAKLGTGIDNVDLEAARERGITVTYTPGHNALSVAEHTVCLTLATARRLTEARTLVDSGGWRDELTPGTRLSGSTVGIVGFGNVGKRVGTLLSGFAVEVLIHDPYVPEPDAELVGGDRTSLDDLLERSDVVVLTAELTDETRGLIGPRELSLMRDSAFVVNTARGPIVRESALLDALSSGSIAGAGLDVFASEPLDPDSPLLELDNVVATPHAAALTTEARAETIDRLADNVERIVAGGDLPDRYVATRGAE